MSSPNARPAVGSAGARITLGMSAESLHRHDSITDSARLAGRLAARRESYDLTGLAGRLLYDPAKRFAEQHRTVWCHRRMKSEGRIGHIYRRDDGTGARLTGVTTCGMVWTCKVCAGRVAEQRRLEIERGMVKHVAAGGHVYLLTLTAPHERTLTLREFRRQLAKALQKFKNCKAYKRVRAMYQHAGSIRSLELTWSGANGWHLHSHDLYFAQPGLEADAHALDDLKGAWCSALIKVGLGDQSKLTWMLEHGLDLRGGQAAADYVTKFGHDAQWGMSAEVTRSHAKLGMRAFSAQTDSSVTPFQILAWAGNGDAEAVRLFREYADAMADARMLYWSPKLKAKLGIDVRDDAEVAGDDEQRPEETNVAQITGEDLALILSRNALGEMLWFVCTVDASEPEHIGECVCDFLAVLRSRPATGRGVIRVRRWDRRDHETLTKHGLDRFDTVKLTDAGELKAA